MPSTRRMLTDAAAEHLCALMFEPSEQRIGLELEWPVHCGEDVTARPAPGVMRRAAQAELPYGSRITFEPGGQVELSSAPQRCVADALEAVRADEQALRSELAALGLAAETMAVDDRRPPLRVLDHGRYAAMEAFFAAQGGAAQGGAAQGGAGRWMMCNTAGLQVNISHDSDDPSERWRTMHLIAPTLIAAFANSPGTSQDGTRWASVRQGIWWSIDQARTRPVRTDMAPGRAWLDYALAADVMFVNGHGPWGPDGMAIPPGLPFGGWMANGHDIGWPTPGDLQYHLSTLFPPVRPRGWLELRVLDALPEWIREVAALVVAAACTREAGRELRNRITPPSRPSWRDAARYGLRHPEFLAAARELFTVAQENLGRVSDRAGHAALVEGYRREYVEAGRMPGDDLARQVDLRPSVSLPPALASK